MNDKEQTSVQGFDGCIIVAPDTPIVYHNDEKVYELVNDTARLWRDYKFWQARKAYRELIDHATDAGFYNEATGFAGVSEAAKQSVALIDRLTHGGHSLCIMRRDLYVMFVMQIDACKAGNIREAYDIGVYANIDANTGLRDEVSEIQREGWTCKFRDEIGEYLTPEIEKDFMDDDWATMSQRFRDESDLPKTRRIRKAARDAREKLPLQSWVLDGVPPSIYEPILMGARS